MDYHIICESPGKAEYKSFNIRSINNDEVFVRILYTLISNGTEKARLSVAPNTNMTFPYVPGYSGVGIVEKVGSTVKSLKVNDRVFVSHGGHASRCIAKSFSIVKIPDNVDFIDAVFTKMASFPMHGLRNTRFEMGESVVIVGLGMLGLLGIQLAKIGGALPVIAIGNREIRRNLALQFGADYVFDPNEDDIVKKVINSSKYTSNAADVVIETSGTADALNLAAKYMSKYGRIALVGCNRITEKPIDLYQFHVKGITIIGSNANTQKNYESQPGIWTGRKNFTTILGMMADGRLTPQLMEPIIFDPTSASKVYDELLHNREFPLGVIFDWTKV